MDKLRHDWYKYKESFSQEIVTRAINESELSRSDVVIDPFNGSGTVTLAASINGIHSTGIEVNPFAAFLASTKHLNPNINDFRRLKEITYRGITRGADSPLLRFSTFSEKGKKSKWLFNSEILNSFEGGWDSLQISNNSSKNIIQLALIGAAMDNSNAVRDGKCLKYKRNWIDLKYGKEDFLNSFAKRLDRIEDNLEFSNLKSKTSIITGDARTELSNLKSKPFKLCITSPPYLNSFDYTDLYRPELFLGKFINSNEELKVLRTKTLRSHVEIKIQKPVSDDFGLLYKEVIKKINDKKNLLWDKQIPLMIQAYFEDMFNVFSLLRKNADTNSSLWVVVSNSAYADTEIPVDLIFADIGSKAGWYLKEIEVLKFLKKRTTKYSPNITNLRESIIKFNSIK